MAIVRFYNISWSHINDISTLPKDVEVEIAEEKLDEEDIESQLSFVLLDVYGSEHNGFDYEIVG